MPEKTVLCINNFTPYSPYDFYISLPLILHIIYIFPFIYLATLHAIFYFNGACRNLDDSELQKCSIQLNVRQCPPSMVIFVSCLWCHSITTMKRIKLSALICNILDIYIHSFQMNILSAKLCKVSHMAIYGHFARPFQKMLIFHIQNINFEMHTLIALMQVCTRSIVYVIKFVLKELNF